jgi:hypothetical protein
MGSNADHYNSLTANRRERLLRRISRLLLTVLCLHALLITWGPQQL